MKKLGYRAVDMLVDRLADDSIPPLRRASADEMEQRLHGPAPDEPQDFDEILRRLEEDVLPFASRGDHPGFFAFIPFSGTWPGALGDFIASATNVFAGSWMESAGPSRLELQVIDWFKDWIGYPAEAAGLLVSGGSAANLAALACARETLAGQMTDDLVAYVSDQAHSSLARSARHLGFQQSQLRVIPTDGSYRMRPDLLESAMQADMRNGRRPLFVSATGGGTNTGAVDPLPEILTICRDRGAWFHVDAAYGGFSVLDPRGREQLHGLDLADSITLDPHKWLYQPYECGCLLVRRGEFLRNAFVITPGLPARGRGPRARGELLRPRHAAQPHVTGFQGLGLVAVLRARRLPPRDRPQPRPRRARRAAASKPATSSSSRPSRPLGSSASAVSSRTATKRLSTRDSCRRSRRAGSGWCPPRACTGATRSGCAC